MNARTIFIAATAAVTLTFLTVTVLTSGSANAGPQCVEGVDTLVCEQCIADHSRTNDYNQACYGRPAPASTAPSTKPAPASSSVPTGSPNAGPAQYKAIVNGQDITAAGGTVLCEPSEDIYGSATRIMTGGSNPNPPTYFDVRVNDSSLKVSGITLGTNGANGKVWSYNIGGAGGTYGSPGNATATRSGKTYKITGNIPSGLVGGGPGSTLGDLVPFEFDATCP